VLHLDIPTTTDIRRLAATRADACVSIYLPTTPLTQQAEADRTVLANLLKQALTELGEAGFDKRRARMIEEGVSDIVADYEFWAFQANSLAVLATPDNVTSFRLANALKPLAEVSNRFHLKPLLRAVTFPHVALVLALSENAVRVVEVFAEGRPEVLAIPDMPRDAASAVRQASLTDRSPSRRIQGSEGKKVRLTQYARRVDRALRPVLAAVPAPLILAATEPLRSIFRSVCGAATLLPDAIASNPDRLSEGELAAAARPILDASYAREIAAFAGLFEAHKAVGRATSDLSDAARAAAHGAIEALAVDIDVTIPGTFDEATGAISFGEAGLAETYGVIDAVAVRALETGARVLAVRAAEVPDRGTLAAVLRYAG